MFFCTFAPNSKVMKLNRIKSVLVENDYSQTQLAKELGKSFSTINAYCCNRQQPTLAVLQQIADILDVGLKDLIVDKSDNKNINK